MEKRIEMSLLLDYYGELLTDKQKDIMNLYYNEDLSLMEISEHTNTSRQAIYDIIKRCEKQLLKYESSLKLLKKSVDRNNHKNKILYKIEKLKADMNCTDNINIIEDIKKDIIENL